MSVDKKKHYVVEFRYPVSVNASSETEAADLARKEIEKTFGFLPDRWYTRVFEYGTEAVGVVAEFFCNPQGTAFRKIDQNVAPHEQLIKEKSG